MPRRQRDAWGSIEEVERGRKYHVRWWGDSHDGTGYRRQSRVIRGTRRDAEEFRALMHVRHGEDAPCPTIGEAWELWYKPDCDRALAVWERERKPGKRGESMKPQTYAQVMSTWRAHVGPRWADVPASGVRHVDVQEWLYTKTEQIAKRCLTMLRGILRFCVMNEVLESNVANFDYRIPSKARRYDNGVWSLEELNERLWPAVWGRVCAVPALGLRLMPDWRVPCPEARRDRGDGDSRDDARGGPDTQAGLRRRGAVGRRGPEEPVEPTRGGNH